MIPRFLRKLLPSHLQQGARSVPWSQLAARDMARMEFADVCPLLEFHELAVAGAAGPTAQLQGQLFNGLKAKWAAEAIERSVPFANDSITIQLAEMFQALHDMDHGDMGYAAIHSLDGDKPQVPGSMRKRAKPETSAAFTPSIGPSSHTNPHPTLMMQLKAEVAEEEADAEIRFRHMLTKRVGFSLWLGPSQVPTSKHKAGVYLKGHVPAGTVVALYPGAAWNPEMRLRASDGGCLRDPRLPRRLIKRYDDCDIDIDNMEALQLAQRNPYAVGQHIRFAPPALSPNVMRIQYDFTAPPLGDDADANASFAALGARAARSARALDTGRVNADADGVMPFPPHLRDYIPNVWGADVSLGQALYSSVEQVRHRPRERRQRRVVVSTYSIHLLLPLSSVSHLPLCRPSFPVPCSFFLLTCPSFPAGHLRQRHGGHRPAQHPGRGADDGADWAVTHDRAASGSGSGGRTTYCTGNACSCAAAARCWQRELDCRERKRGRGCCCCCCCQYCAE